VLLPSLLCFKQFRLKTVKYKICANILYLIGFNSELFRSYMKSYQRTYYVCTQPVAASIEICIIPSFVIIILIISLYLTFVKVRPRPEIMLSFMHTISNQIGRNVSYKCIEFAAFFTIVFFPEHIN
jgi:hypothetical protein